MKTLVVRYDDKIKKYDLNKVDFLMLTRILTIMSDYMLQIRKLEKYY